MQVELRDISKRFGTTLALDRVDLTIRPGERVALIGPNGSGKTTLTRVIMGMLRAEGAVTVGQWSPFSQRQKLAANIAYIPQIAPQMNVPIGPLIEVICSVRSMPASRVDAVAARLDFQPRQHADKPFRDLSGGMKQKLLIALALAARPRLLIMDEPSSSLDAEARRNFFELCSQLDPETTVLLCSHRLEEVRHLIERVVALEDGRVVADGPVQEFVAGLGRAAVELRTTDPSDEMLGWLDEHGFRQMAGGRFVSFLPWNDKLPTVETLIERWGPRVDDLVVNDLHEMQVEADPGRTSHS